MFGGLLGAFVGGNGGGTPRYRVDPQTLTVADCIQWIESAEGMTDQGNRDYSAPLLILDF